MLRHLERHVTPIFVVALASIAAGIALADYHAAQRIEAERLVLHTHDVLSEFDAVLSELNEAESSERGFALTGDETFVPPFERAGALVARHLASVRALVADDPRQQQRLDNLALSAARKLGAMRAIIGARRSGGLDSAVLATAATADATDLSIVRDSVAALERDERRLLAVRRQALDASARHTSWAVLVLGAASLAILGLAASTVRSARRRERDAERRTIEANSQLRLRVDELVWHGRESAGLQQLGEALQLCLTPGEAYAAIAQVVPVLAATSGGGGFLAVTRTSRNQVESVAGWGTLAGDHSVATMAPEDCCALRSGRPYVVRAGEARLRCVHAASGVGDYVCFPLSAHGETLGILHVAFSSTEPDPDRDTPPSEVPDDAAGALYDSRPWPSAGPYHARLVLLRRASEQIAVALANLALRERLTQQSIRDALTDTFNRRYFEESLDREMIRARRYDRGLALVMLDVDHFKRVNDKHGHDTGDEVLRSIADVLRRSVRAVDLVCRYGGEEFAILLPEITPEAARERSQSIVDACRSRRIVSRGQSIGTVTISAGLAHASPGETGVDLLRRADAALYAAKRGGRDRVVEASAAPASTSPERVSA